MKKSLFIILTFVACLIAGSPVATAQRGQKAVGVRTGYNTSNESALAGITFSYQFSDHVRIAPNADYVFRKNNTDAFIINCNMHFPWQLGALPINVYPLVGVNYALWSLHSNPISETNDTGYHETRFGANVGGGVEWYATSTLKVALEGKFEWVKDFNTGVFSIGIAYVF